MKTFLHKVDFRENKTIPKSVLLRQEQAQYLKDCWEKTKHGESLPVPACELAIFQLPSEVIVNILVHLRNPIDAINFGQTCRAVNEIVSSNDLWRTLYVKYFGQTEIDFGCEWKNACVLRWQLRTKFSEKETRNAIVLEQQQVSLQTLDEQNQKLTARVQTLEKFLDGLLSVDPNAPVSAIEEEVFARTAKKKLKNDSVITVNIVDPFCCKKITQPEKACCEASQRTIRARSQEQFLYNATTIVCSMCFGRVSSQ